MKEQKITVPELMRAATEDPPRHFLVADTAMCVHLTRDREQSMVSISQVLPRGNSFARGLQLPVDLGTRSVNLQTALDHVQDFLDQVQKIKQLFM